MVVAKATTSTSSRASSSRLPPAPMTLGTSFLLVATRVPDRRMQSHSEYAYYKPSPWTSSKTSSPRSARSGRLEGRYLHPCSETHATRCARAASGHVTAAPPSSVMKSRWSDAYLLRGGLRRRLPRDEFPALRRLCPGIEEHEPQAARLAIDLRLDRRAAGDECGVARQAHLAIAASRALVLRLSRAQGGKPRRLGVGEP